jgi:N6-L-threonylcarbamoyladenine synthase
MLVLGIETSCDETAAAVVKDGSQILSNIVASSLEFHKKYGGIIPEIASRKQLETISQVTEEAIKKAKINLEDLDLISVTKTPGLLGSLLVGVSFAKALSYSLKTPLLEVNHLYSHLYSAFLQNKRIEFPCVGLVISGGHTSLFYLKDFKRVKLLGETRDDAVGEAFDKVAKILGFGFPGGPIIERLAKKGDSSKIRFKCAQLEDSFDFSFSGIKTAVLYTVGGKRLAVDEIKDICASFQEAVVDILIKKSLDACKKKKTKNLVVGGGVAANLYLRDRFRKSAKEENLEVYFPSLELCLDNAAMVAGLGYQLFKIK